MRPGSGIVSFLDAGPVFSIEAVIWTAVGGRGTIIGAFIGTFLVKGAEFLLSGILASFWQLIMGALFILVVLCVPRRHRRFDRQLDAQAQKGARSQQIRGSRSHGPRPAARLGTGRRLQGGREPCSADRSDDRTLESGSERRDG